MYVCYSTKTVFEIPIDLRQVHQIFKHGYQLIIINVSIPNPLHINFLNFDLQRLPLISSSKQDCMYDA